MAKEKVQETKQEQEHGNRPAQILSLFRQENPEWFKPRQSAGDVREDRRKLDPF